LSAISSLEPFVTTNPLGLHGCIPVGRDLLETLKNVRDEIHADLASFNEQIGVVAAHDIFAKWQAFEFSLKADLAIANLYVTTPKGAYDTLTLAENGLMAFPSSLPQKVPEAEKDAQQAARCIAFDLPTAAAFHLHRANEAVIHAYYKAIAPNKNPPSQRAASHWITAIEKELGQEKIVAALRDIQSLHRNPVLHPEESVGDSEEAIALMGAIIGCMRHMLKAIS
jgi:hypothetical protein